MRKFTVEYCDAKCSILIATIYSGAVEMNDGYAIFKTADKVVAVVKSPYLIHSEIVQETD